MAEEHFSISYAYGPPSIVFNVLADGEQVFDFGPSPEPGVIVLYSKADRQTRFYRRGIVLRTTLRLK